MVVARRICWECDDAGARMTTRHKTLKQLNMERHIFNRVPLCKKHDDDYTRYYWLGYHHGRKESAY